MSVAPSATCVLLWNRFDFVLFPCLVRFVTAFGARCPRMVVHSRFRVGSKVIEALTHVIGWRQQHCWPFSFFRTPRHEAHFIISLPSCRLVVLPAEPTKTAGAPCPDGHGQRRHPASGVDEARRAVAHAAAGRPRWVRVASAEAAEAPPTAATARDFAPLAAIASLRYGGA